jgi:very-short-patch-repair endonuclease
MILNRPPLLSKIPHYSALPTADIAVDFSALPPLLKLDLDTLSGVQPITRATAEAAGGTLRDNVSHGEATLHRRRAARFQLVLLVLNVFALKEQPDGTLVGRPYAISLLPASKRGAAQEVGLEWVEKFSLEPSPFTGKGYLGFDPFSGERGLFGDIALLRSFGGTSKVHPDEFGFVTGGYLLTSLIEGDDPLLPDAGMLSKEANARYVKHRARKYFKRFTSDRPRRVWGLESPIELFLAQGLAGLGLYPEFQTLFLSDGAVFPSYYHMLDDPQMRRQLDAITAADLYFPDQKLAVFCDSTRFHRGRQHQSKDDAITRKLTGFGINVLRIPGSTIVGDLSSAVARVLTALDREGVAPSGLTSG